MIANKSFLPLVAFMFFIATISPRAEAVWCGNSFFAPIQSGPNAGNLNCNNPSNNGVENCYNGHVVLAANECVTAAAGAVSNNPTNQAAIANYTNLSWYFYGSYDYSGVRTAVVTPRVPVSPGPNVNVVGACGAQQNGANAQICMAANTAVMNPNFVVPTVAPPVPQQTPAQCFSTAYKLGNTLLSQYIANIQARNREPHPNITANIVAISEAENQQKTLQANCSGSTQNVAGCTQSVKTACSSMQKSQYMYCNNATMLSLITNCQ